jgi:hypothetical protein
MQHSTFGPNLHRRQWRKLALEWQPELADASAAIKRHYQQLLLAYEIHVSQDAPFVTKQVTHPSVDLLLPKRP